MKNLTIFLCLFLFFSISSRATHLQGGEITWECTSNGKYIFSMNVYFNCSTLAASWQFQNESIGITGFPLPAGLSSITVKPDSVAWQAAGGGDVSPLCTSNYGTAYSCSNNSLGALKVFPYKSDPISLSGVPPVSGWKFTWSGPCCRGTKKNITSSSGNTLLRAIMYRAYGNLSVDSCYDSSPRFTDLPQTTLCRASLQEYNHAVVDKEYDKLTYRWRSALTGSPTNTQNITYATGYASYNPTPSSSFHPSNIPSTVNAETGDVTFSVHNGTNIESYLTVLEVSNWRNNRVISKVYREIPFSITDCPPLPSGDTNKRPVFTLSTPVDANGVYRDTVTAGTFVNHIITVSDYDSVGHISGNLQTVKLIPFGQSFTANYAQSGGCASTSCAFLNPAPSFNINPQSQEYELSGIGGLGTNFQWQTDCSSLRDSLYSRTHYFRFKFMDDHCPLPQVGYKTLAITVLPAGQPCNLSTAVNPVKETFQKETSIFPNPTNGMFTIQSKGNYEYLEVEVRNVQGKVVEKKELLNQADYNIDLKGKPGIYFLRIINEKGETANYKVIKQ